MPRPNTEHTTRTPQKEPPEGSRKAVAHELKRQTEQRKEREKPEVHADRPRDAKLKPERKGVI